MANHQYKVGQSVYVAAKHRRWRKPSGAPYAATIRGVGRKYVHLDNGRKYDIETGHEESNHNSGMQLWPSREVYENHAIREVQWSDLRAWVECNYDVPEHLTFEQIITIRNMLEGK